MVNANAFDGIVCDALGADWYRTASSTAVAHINQGDVIFIWTHHNITTSGDISNYINARTSFVGWFLFLNVYIIHEVKNNYNHILFTPLMKDVIPVLWTHLPCFMTFL